MIIISMVSFLAGWVIGRGPVVTTTTLKPESIRLDHWEELPSGWTRDVGMLTIYAMSQGGEAYWWVSRNGKTIIEGPADTLEDAQRSAEQEARELSV